MTTPSFLPTYRTLLALCLLAPALHGQTAIQLADSKGRLSKPDEDAKQSPYLLEEETADVGPQYLLPETEAQPWLKFSSDLLITRTNNATLSEYDPQYTNITIWTNNLSITPPQTLDLFGGELGSVFGIQHQTFRYGMPGDENKWVDYVPVKFNDFDTTTPYAEAVWTQGNWIIRAGLQYQSLKDRTSGHQTYEETTPYLIVGKSFLLEDNRYFYVEYTGWYRFTETETFGFPPEDANDRTDHRITLLYRQSLFDPNFIVEPSVSLRYTDYTQDYRDREDLYTTASLSGTYYFNQYFSMRLEMTYEHMDTSEPFTQEYEVFDVGLGATVSLRF